jgi:hypothetical protein
MVNQYYFYLVDEEFGPAFIKFSSYFPYTGRVCLNGHEYVKRHLTREGIRDGLERVKQLPASSGMEGTTMGFGHYDHGALKGRYLVLRRWENGKTVQVEDQ